MKLLRIITIGIPLVFLVSAAIAGLAYERFSADRTKWAFSDINKSLSGDINAQRTLANCYKDGCTYAPPDPVYECAWRKTILQEENQNPVAADERAETRGCDRVRPFNRKFVTIALKEIAREMAAQNSKPKLVAR